MTDEALSEEFEKQVRAWLNEPTGPDSAAIRIVAPAVVKFVQDSRARRDIDGNWTADTRLGAVMLAARLVRRRNSPAGIEGFTSDATVYVRRNDPDVARLLRLDAPAIG